MIVNNSQTQDFQIKFEEDKDNWDQFVKDSRKEVFLLLQNF